MTSRMPSAPDDLLRRLGTQVVPVDAPERVWQRQERVVGALSRGIRQNADRRRVARARWGFGVGLAASVALAAGVAAHVRQGRIESNQASATVGQVQGAVVVTESGQSRVLSRGGVFSLHAVGEIETALDAQAEIHSQKSVVHLSPATKLTVPQATRLEERYRLALGRVDVSVDKDSRVTRSVVVETPNAEIVVHGTVFAVGVAPRSQHTVTDVSVTRGSVWVLANGVQVAVLGPGQHWSSEGQAPLNVPAAAQASSVASSDGDAPSTDEHHASAKRRVGSSSVEARGKASTLAEQGNKFQEAIDARNHGDDAHSEELFARLVTRYPNYEEAEVQLFRAQKRLGQTAAAAASARRYLAAHPQGFAHEEARGVALNFGASADN